LTVDRNPPYDRRDRIRVVSTHRAGKVLGRLLALAGVAGALAAPGVAGAAPVDVRGTWDLTCSGCGAQHHTFETEDFSTGAVTGRGTSEPPSSTTWTITGTVRESTIQWTLKYDSGSYQSTTTGTVSGDNQTITGTFTDNAGNSNVPMTMRRLTPPPSGSPTVPPPVLAKSVNVAPVSGKVFVSVPAGSAFARLSVPGIKGRTFVPLTAARQIPVDSLLDTRRGSLSLTSASTTAGQVFTGTFSAGVFQALQSRSGLTTLPLKGSSFRSCTARPGRAAAALSRRVVRRMRGNASGRFRTRGRYSAATVRGTIWETVDRCDGTLTKVTRGTVIVRDNRKRRNITVRAGKSYLARAPG